MVLDAERWLELRRFRALRQADATISEIALGAAYTHGGPAGRRWLTWGLERLMRLVMEGHGRPGFVKGTSIIALRASGDATAVDVSGAVTTGGPIARLGQRLTGGVVKMMLDRFFACLRAKVVAPS